MKRMRKLTTLLLAGAMLASLFGCSNSEMENVSAKKPEQAASQKELEIWTRGSETDATGPSLIAAVKQYEEKTGIKVNLQFIAHNDVVTKWNAAFASGTAPDIIDLGIVHMTERINLGHIIPLDDYYNTWENKDNLIPAMKELGTYQDHLYAIGHFPDPQVFMYRKDMFEEAGLDSSRPPKDWNEMLAYANQLTQKDANGNVTRCGFAVPTIGARFLANILVHQNGSSFINEADGTPNLETPEALETMQFLSDLHQNSSTFQNDNWGENPLLKDAAAMGYVPNGVLKNYLKNNPDNKDKIGVTACVPNKAKAAWSGVWFYGITSQSKDPDQAFDLISYLTSEEVLTKRMEEAGLPSAFTFTSQKFIDLDPMVNQAIIDAIECGYGNPKVSYSVAYEKAIDQATEEIFYGTKTPEEALKTAQESLLQEIK